MVVATLLKAYVDDDAKRNKKPLAAVAADDITLIVEYTLFYVAFAHFACLFVIILAPGNNLLTHSLECKCPLVTSKFVSKEVAKIR